MVSSILVLFERWSFGVIQWWANKLGLSAASIRMFFIYAAFLTFGSTFILYLLVYFIMNVHKHLRRKRSPIWDF